MDLLILIAAPLSLALIYVWPGSRGLPRGVPVVLLGGLFAACLGYGPAVQEAAATKTPLIHGVDVVTFYMDGLSLLLLVLVTGIALASALYAAFFVQSDDLYRRATRRLLISVSLLLGLLLVNHTTLFFGLWMLIMAWSLLLIQSRTRLVWLSLGLAVLGGLALLIAFLALGQAGAQVKQLEQPVYEMVQISTANLSKHDLYNLSMGGLLIAVMTGAIFQTITLKDVTGVDRAGPAPTVMAPYVLLRFYPALHDNPLWWIIITGGGLLLMLLGAVWAVWQRDDRRLLIGMTVSLLGACLALLGLPDSLGTQAALMGTGVYSLTLAALFMSQGLSRRWMFVVAAPAMLSMAVVDVVTLNAFYAVMLPWAGIALAVVVLSTALLTAAMLRVLWGSTERQEASPGQSPVPLLLSVAALGWAVLFAAVFVPLLPALIWSQSDVDISALGLSLLAWGGGAILYATQPAWSRFFIQGRRSPASEAQMS